MSISKRRRFREIVAVLVKYGFKEDIRNPENARLALEELGPTFTKIGQILSTRPDIIPEEFIYEFQKLQDDVKPENPETIEGIIEEELGKKPEYLFSSFDTSPMASASIAQVHRATLKNGEKVVVKIKRPNIENTILTDLSLLNHASKVIKFLPQGSILNPQEIVAELYQSLKEELDFINESKNIQDFYQLNKDVNFLKVPKLYSDFVTENILVMEYIKGHKISHKFDLLKEGYEPKEIAMKLLSNYLKQVFEDGFFHADPHPGNILVSDGKIAYLDFGLMGKLSTKLRDKFNQLLLSFVTGDVEAITQIVLRIGIKKGRVDRILLQSDIEDLYNEYVTASIDDIEIPELVNQLFNVCRKHKISIPKNITLILKGFLLMEGNLNKLSPETTIMEIASPYVKNQLLKNKDIKTEIISNLEGVYRFSKAFLKIPEKFLSVLNKASSGTIQVHMDHTNLDKNINKITKAADRIVFALVISALIIGSSQVITSEAGPMFYDVSILGLIGFVAAALMGVWLLIAILRSGRV